MTEEKSLLDLGADEFLRRKIKYLKNKVKELHSEIKRSEELLRNYEEGLTMRPVHDPKQLSLAPISASNPQLDFSLPFWKHKTHDFLFDQTASYTTDQILVGVDLNKVYQRDKDVRARAIKAISTSLFHLHKEGKVEKIENPGRRGFKWAYKEMEPNA